MTPITMRRFLGRWRRDEGGVAAIEFALIMPLMTLIFFAIVELSRRYEIYGDINHFNYQLGDYLSRSETLVSGDVDDIFDAAKHMMQSVDLTAAELSLTVVSIGYDTDGKPVLLWKRERGPKPPAIDLEKAVALAEGGQSVIMASTTLKAPTVLDLFGAPEIELITHDFFRPRVTRAIAMDGKLVDGGVEIDGYSNG
jgi:Flp pilus assembly protein TadG